MMLGLGGFLRTSRRTGLLFKRARYTFLMWKLFLALWFFFACCLAHAQDNSSVRALFVEDQRDRGIPYADDGVHMLSKAEADKLPDHSQDFGARDVGRLKQAKTLLGNGSIVTAHDFRYAALLFQHGQKADDYLMAHVLAIRAVGLGDLSSQNLAALTLDRYLQSIGRGQIFGSQYLTESYAYRLQHSTEKNVDEKAAAKGDADTLQPYDESLVPDSLRHSFCIASLAEQKKAVEDARKTKNLEIPIVRDCHFK
jgi:hypothetical protein